MKKVEATINPSRLEEVRDALVELGITGMTASEIRAYHPSTHSNWYRGSEYTVSFAPRVKIETVVDEGQLDGCLSAIGRCADADDTDVVVFAIEDAIHIRTGEHAARAA